MREEACPRCFLHARSVSGTNQVLLGLGYSNLASGACAGRSLAGIQPLEMVGEFLNGRRFMVHLTVSLPARGFVSGHPERHIPVADDRGWGYWGRQSVSSQAIKQSTIALVG